MTLTLKTDSSHYFYSEIVKAVEEKLGFDIRDCGKHYFPESVSFDEFCDRKYGKNKKDPEGKHRSGSKIWWKEYKNAIRSGEIKELPYLDFWHFQLDRTLSDVSNGKVSRMCVGTERFEKEDFWIREIQNAFNEVCKDIMDERGYVDVMIRW